MPEVRFKRLKHGEGLDLPVYASSGAAGLDICSAEDLVIPPGERAMVDTGFAVEVPYGFEMQVRPRSGLAAKHGISVVNTPGTVDSDYRGEIKIILINHGDETFEVERGDRIAQLIVAASTRVEVREVGELSTTRRGEDGFGSTGRRFFGQDKQAMEGDHNG